MNVMTNRERGEGTVFVVLTVVFGSLMLIAGIAFAWAFMQMTDYRDNVDSKVTTAVDEARESQKSADQKQFEEDYKKPHDVFMGPASYGAVSFEYPKTWSAYLADNGANGQYKVYLHPKTVPTVNEDTAFALRVNIISRPYKEVLDSYEFAITEKYLKATPITVGKTETFDGFKGTRLDGQFREKINGSMVVFEIRDKTLMLSVDNQSFMPDFNNIVLKTLTYKE